MPDPTNPPIIDNTQIKETANVANLAQEAISGLGNAAKTAGGFLEGLHGQLESLNTSMIKNQNLTQGQTTALGLLTTAALGARKSFEGLAGIDYSNLDTFGKQMKELKAVFGDDGAAFAAGSAGAKKLGESLAKSGATGKEFKEALAAGGDALLTFADKFFASADNALKLQHANIQLAASTGQLGEMFKASGDHLANINLLTAQYQKQVTDAAKATGLSTEQIEKYYGELGRVPGALNSVITAGDGSGKSINMLTSAIQYATGSGRNLIDITKDLTIAYKDYNLIGQGALEFTARMGELANKFHTPLEDVRASLTSTAESFRMYGNEAEGAAKMMNQYMASLQSGPQGLSGSAALDVINGMTSGIKNLNIAQKAFISAQTGGPGGLMGGFQIEEMLREGKMDEVMNKVKQTLTKNMGPLVDLKEAAASPQAAAQLQKEIMMLRQGPLGQFAKDDQSAIRLIESMKSGKPVGDITKTDPLHDAMEKGTDIQAKSYTTLRSMLGIMEESRGSANISNLGVAQSVSTAGTGAPNEGDEKDSLNQARLRQNLKDGMDRSAKSGGVVVGNMADDLAHQKITKRTGEFADQNVKNWIAFYDNMGPALKAPLEKIQKLFTEGKTSEANAGLKDLKDNLTKQRAEAEKMRPVEKEARMQEIMRNSSDLDAASKYLKDGFKTKADAGVPKMPGIDLTELGIKTPHLGGIAGHVADLQKSASTTPSQEGGAHARGPATARTNLGELTVHVDLNCPHCGTKLQNSPQAASISPQTGQSH